MEKIRVGVIGCGSIAQHRHLPEYGMNKNVEIVALCDKNEERVHRVAEEYGAKPYTDYRELIESGTVDAVSVCTPNYLHAEISIYALNQGLHVLCEKPLATSREEAEAMIEAEKRSGKKLMIGHNQRLVSSHQKARELIKNGEIGRIFSFRTTFGHGGPAQWSVEGKESWFFKKDEAIIGAMGDLGVHKTDLLRYLLDEEFAEVGAFVEDHAKDYGDTDDNAVCVLKTKSGIIGTLAASWAYMGKEDNSTIIYGEKAILRLEEDPTYSLIVQYVNGETVNYQLGKIQTNEDGGQRSTGVIDAFIHCIVEDESSPVSGEEGLKSLSVVLAALESSRTKRITEI
ncbi:Gfo/Idh/MocA family protein [Priestia filamentosa]|uniref:Gfo/Idh/MocA family protein n=1 Tax=Priestia filamentosa TaxID=1402861 RepID=UPI000A08739D|nr:Gfo/Idh/MocA family oxidoreductase [Priestia filamentosa]MDT3763952.1 Gfo/Idh/MocA family oxidoreductase [Priestia filamentosa]OXS71572.1 dehydrogenase [Priestia filamentosa]WRU94361.1 Gfo/Idh/MocA family oxidoreductase [Priestia filamentosa]SMF10935.1 Predicted dehydrogenase [Priestia filamentosa]